VLAKESYDFGIDGATWMVILTTSPERLGLDKLCQRSYYLTMTRATIKPEQLVCFKRGDWSVQGHTYPANLILGGLT
jgi:hypothetical protein